MQYRVLWFRSGKAMDHAIGLFLTGVITSKHEGKLVDSVLDGLLLKRNDV